MKKFLNLLIVVGLVLSMLLLSSCSVLSGIFGRKSSSSRLAESSNSSYLSDNSSSNSSDNSINYGYSEGSTIGNIYMNLFANITFTKPDSWEFQDGTSTSISVMVMNAKESSTGNNINIQLEDLSATGNSSITASQYIKTFLNTEDKSGLPSGMEIEIVEDDQIAFLGEELYDKATCKSKYLGVTMDQYIYCRKIDNYMCCIVITVVDGTDEDYFEDMFS